LNDMERGVCAASTSDRAGAPEFLQTPFFLSSKRRLRRAPRGWYGQDAPCLRVRLKLSVRSADSFVRAFEKARDFRADMAVRAPGRV
jgi:hypothetical protein